MARPLRVALIAGEHSGDNLGAGFIEALRRQAPEARFVGVAGPRMVEAGCERWEDADSLAVMGLFEVLRHLPRLLRLKRRLVTRLLAEPPDVFVGIDAPEFNLSIAPVLHAAGIPTVQYVSPQVWAWREGRVKRMARMLDLVLCLLPFEAEFYRTHRLRAEFVGHPLADRLPLQPDRNTARRELGLPEEATVVALLPGSRRGEYERLSADLAGAAAWLAGQRRGLVFAAPMASEGARKCFAAALEREAPGVDCLLVNGQAARVMSAADVVVTASGTATLETLLCKRPMVVVYRLGAATAWVLRRLRLVKSTFFSQPNLLAGSALVPELFQEAVSAESVGREVLRWLDSPDAVADLEQVFLGIHQTLRRGASERAAEAVLALLRDRGG